MQFVNRSDKALHKFYEANPSLTKLLKFNFNDTNIQERMMRIGVEAKTFEAKTEDDLFVLAVATIQDDYVRNNACKLAFQQTT